MYVHLLFDKPSLIFLSYIYTCMLDNVVYLFIICFYHLMIFLLKERLKKRNSFEMSFWEFSFRKLAVLTLPPLSGMLGKGWQTVFTKQARISVCWKSTWRNRFRLILIKFDSLSSAENAVVCSDQLRQITGRLTFDDRV